MATLYLFDDCKDLLEELVALGQTTHLLYDSFRLVLFNDLRQFFTLVVTLDVLETDCTMSEYEEELVG